MADEHIGGAYIRIRPDFTGFREQVREHTRETMREVRREVATIAVGAFALGGVSEFIRDTTKVAGAMEAAQAQVRQTLKNTGAASRETQEQVNEQLEAIAQRAGVAFPEVAAGFVRLQGQVQNTTTALRDTSIAADVARSRHIQLGQAALAIARYEGGSANSLSRLGFILGTVNTQQQVRQRQLGRDQTALAEFTRTQDLTNASGVKLTQTQRLQAFTQKEALQAAVAHDKALLAQARTTDTLASRTEGIDELQRRVAGSAASYANTAAGAQDRFKVAIEGLQVSMANVLLPSVTGVFHALTDYTSELAHSESFHRDLSEAVSSGATVLHTFADALGTVGPPLLQVVEAGAKIAGTIGGGPLAAGLIAYRTLGTLAGRLATEETAAAGASAAVAASQTEVAAALARVEAQLAATTGGWVRVGAAAEAATAAEAEAAAAGSAAGAGGVAARAGIGARLATALVPSPATLAVLGGAAVVAGLVYLSTRETQAERAARSLRGALDDLAAGEERMRTATEASTVAQERLTEARERRAEAASTVADAREQVAASREAVTQLGRQGQQMITLKQREEDLTAAARDWRAANRNVLGSLHDLDQALASQGAATRHQRNEVDQLWASMNDLYAADEKVRPHAGPFDAQTEALARNKTAVADLTRTLGEWAAANRGTSPELARNTQLVREFVTRTRQVPPRAVTHFLLEHGRFDSDFRDALTKLEEWQQANPTTKVNIDTNAAFQALEALVQRADEAGSEIQAAISVSQGGGGAHDTPPGRDTGKPPPRATQQDADIAELRRQQREKDAAAAKQRREEKAARDAAAQADRESQAQQAQQAADQLRQEREQAAQAARERRDAIASATAQARQNIASMSSELSSQVGQIIDAMATRAAARLQATIGPQITRLQGQLDRWQRAREARDRAQALADARRTAAESGQDLPLQQQQAQAQLDLARRQLADLQLHPVTGDTAEASQYQSDLAGATLAVYNAQRQLDDLPRQVARAEQGAADAQQAIIEASTTRRQQNLQTELDRRTTAINRNAERSKTSITQRMADLAAEFQQGHVTLSQFVDQTATMVAGKGGAYTAAGRRLGVAFSSAFAEQLATLQTQAAALLGAHVTPAAGSNIASPWAAGRTGGGGGGGATTAPAGADRLVTLLRSQLGTPYGWGQETAGKGFDCSGLVQWVFRQLGIGVPRTTQAQVRAGTAVPRNKLQVGDCIYFTESGSSQPAPQHVGIYIGGGQMIHAPHTGDVVREAPFTGRTIYGIRRFLRTTTSTTPAGGGGGAATATGAAGSAGGGSAAADVVRQGMAAGLRGAALQAFVATGVQESNLSYGAVGDNSTSFGPFQFHRGGALGSHTQAWAQSVAEVIAEAKRWGNITTGAGAAALQRPADQAGYAADVDKIIASGQAAAIIAQYGGAAAGGARATTRSTQAGRTAPGLPSTLAGALGLGGGTTTVHQQIDNVEIFVVAAKDPKATAVAIQERLNALARRVS